MTCVYVSYCTVRVSALLRCTSCEQVVFVLLSDNDDDVNQISSIYYDSSSSFPHDVVFTPRNKQFGLRGNRC